MVTPEFGSKRIDTVISIIGKMLNLIVYADFIQRFSPQSSHTSEQDRLLAVLMPPLELIFIAGYAFRDDLRLIPEIMHGAGKGMVRACKGSAKHAGGHNHSMEAESDTEENVDDVLQEVRHSDGEKENETEPCLSNGYINPDGKPIYDDGDRKIGRLTSQHGADGDSLA